MPKRPPPTPVRDPAEQLAIEHVCQRMQADGCLLVAWTSNRPAGGRACLLDASGAQLDRRDQPTGRNHRALWQGLDPAASYTIRIVLQEEAGQTASWEGSARARAARPTTGHAGAIALRLQEPTAWGRRAWPVRIGIPLPAGQLADAADAWITDPEDRPVPAQLAATAHWDDGSVQWLLACFLADTDPQQARTYRLRWEPADEQPDQPQAPGAGLLTEPPDVQLAADGEAPARLAWDAGTQEVSGVLLQRRCWRGGQAGWQMACRGTRWATGLEEWDLLFWNDQLTPDWRNLGSLTAIFPHAHQSTHIGLTGWPGRAAEDGELHLLQEDDRGYRGRLGEQTVDGPRYTGAAWHADQTRLTLIQARDFWQMAPGSYRVTAQATTVGLLPDLPEDHARVPERRAVAHQLFMWCDAGRYRFRRGQATRQRILRWSASTDADPEQLTVWLREDLVPEVEPAAICASGVLGGHLVPSRAGGPLLQAHDRCFDLALTCLELDRELQRTWGFMHFGDWFGERGMNYGNNEYDLAWLCALHWCRSGDVRSFRRGLEMALHYSSVDSLHGAGTRQPVPDGMEDDDRDLVLLHSIDHVGCDLPPAAYADGEQAERYRAELASWRRFYFSGQSDQGHVYQPGNWLYARLTGDPVLAAVAERICRRLASCHTSAFDFWIERAAGWPIINVLAAYQHTHDPFFLNAARIFVQRVLAIQDPDTGGWPFDWEREGGLGQAGKPFAVGILLFGLLRYREQVPDPAVDRCLHRAVAWLAHYAWVEDQGGHGHLHYTAPASAASARHQHLHPQVGEQAFPEADYLILEAVAWSARSSDDPQVHRLLQGLLRGRYDPAIIPRQLTLPNKGDCGVGKLVSQQFRQAVFGLSLLETDAADPDAAVDP